MPRRVARLAKRARTEGEQATAGLSRSGSGFPSPTAHVTPLAAIISGSLMALTPMYIARLGEMSLTAVREVLESVKLVLVGVAYNILDLLNEICYQLREIVKALGRVGVTSGYLMQGCLFLLSGLVVLFYAPLVWKLMERVMRFLMVGKAYSSDAVADGRPAKIEL